MLWEGFPAHPWAVWGRFLGTEHSQGSQRCSMGPEPSPGVPAAVSEWEVSGVGTPWGPTPPPGPPLSTHISLDSRWGTHKTFREVKNELSAHTSLCFPCLPSLSLQGTHVPSKATHCCHSICHHLGCTCPQSDDYHTKSTHFLLLPLTRELLPPEAGLIPVINSATLAINRKCPNYCFSSYGVTVKSH